MARLIPILPAMRVESPPRWREMYQYRDDGWRDMVLLGGGTCTTADVATGTARIAITI